MSASTADSSRLPADSSPSKWVTFARYAWFVCAFAVTIILLGALPGYYSHYAQSFLSDPYGLGQFNLPFQVFVGLSDLVSSFISFGLAVLLFWRKPNDRMALFASFFLLITAVISSYSLDYFLSVYFGAPSTYQLGSDLQTPLWILLFCIFPDGRFVPRWTCWIFLISIPASLAIFAGAEWSAISSIVTILIFILVTYAQVYRYRRVSSYTERKQTKWVVFSLVVSLGLSLIASLIYKKLSPPLINVFPIAFTIAILRSHLWDIDVIIRKTLTYTLLTGALLLIFFGSVVILQQGLASVTSSGQNELVTVLSTLAIAALFVPLRNWIQSVIDKRFYRKKYDAQQVLSQFAETVRDETDLEKLTGKLIEVVNETMQPKSVSVWLKREREKWSGQQ